MIRYRYAAFVCLLIGIAAYAGCGGDDGGGSSSSGGSTTDDGGGSGGEGNDGGALKGNAVSPSPSHGSTVAISPDDSRLVVANTESGTATVFAIDWKDGMTPPALEKLVELDVGEEPSAVVVHPSGTAAFVVSRKAQRIVRIDDLGGETPKVGPSAKTGSEPTSIALTPRGTTAWVTSWIDGTVTAFDVADLKVKSTVDLNETLAKAGYLGEVNARPSLAHPRSVGITNNGDTVEEDETMWVTEFYAQTKTPLAADGSNADTARTGLVYKINLADKAASIVELPPIADMGFKDHKGGTAGCFPNQLLNITIQGGFGYVMSVCASPKGPQGMFTGPAAKTCAKDDECPGAVAGSCVATKCTTNCTADADCGAVGGKCAANVCAGNPANVKTQVAPAISVIDLGGNKTIATLNMAKEFDAEFTKRGMPDDGTRRLPLTTFDLGFVPGTVTAYLPSRGTDAVFKIDFNATYEASNIDALGDPKAPFINLTPAGVDPSRIGRMPMGLVVANKLHPKEVTTRYAFVANENTRNVAVLDLATQDIAGRSEGTPNVVTSSAQPADQKTKDEMEGKRLFATGLGRWSLKGQGWGACESCHIDGLSDNVTWFFPRGARQPNSLDGLFSKKDPNDMRLQNWTAVQDELSDHEMGAIRGSLGGVGAIVTSTALDPANRIAIDKIGHAGLGGSSRAAADMTNPIPLAQGSAVDDWDKMLVWSKTVRSPRRPSNLDPALVAAGKSAFLEGKCQGCHGGDKWTTSRVFYSPDKSNAVNASLKTTSWTSAVQSAGFPNALVPATTGANQNMRYNGAAGGDFDQIVCALRPVGTFGVADPRVGVAELRRDMTAKAQGDEPDGRGFNPPSLLGLQVGAPFFHAGQVRTLEDLLSNTFATHREALTQGFLAEGAPGREAKLKALVAFLLSIDEDAETVAIPALGPSGGDFCKVP